MLQYAISAKDLKALPVMIKNPAVNKLPSCTPFNCKGKKKIKIPQPPIYIGTS